MARPSYYLRAFRLLAVLAFASPLAWGQRQPLPEHGPSAATFDITGYVKSELDDQPVPDARLRLITENGNLAHPTVLSSATGEFRFVGFRGGDYFVEAEKDGYESARVRVTIALHGDQVMIRLRPLPNGASKPAVSKAELVRNAAIPEKALDAFHKGVTLLTLQSDYRGAIAQFERAIKAYPGYYEAYAQMGVAQDRLENPAAAEQALRKSIEISGGKYAESSFLLAEILNDQNRFADAEPVARQSIKAEGSSSRGHYELSRALAGLKRDEEAEQSAVKAREIAPESPPVHLLLANIHRRLHNYQALLRDLDTYLELAPSGSASDQARAMREQVRKALEGQPKQSESPQS